MMINPTEPEHIHDKISAHVDLIWWDIPRNRLRPGIWKDYYRALAVEIGEVFGTEHLPYIRSQLRFMRTLHGQHDPSINE